MGIGIDTQALVEEYLSITALPSADEKDKVMFGGKRRNIRHTVRHTAADGIEALESCLWRDMLLDVFDDTMELIQRLRGLAIEIDVTREVELFDILELFDDNRLTLRLTYQSQHFRMTVLAEDDDLSG